MDNKVVAIIPARAGSRSIPKKNIKKLGNHPLIAYSIAAARLSSLIEHIIVSTDSEEIAGISRQYGADVPFLRPAELAQDHSLDIEFFKHFIDFCMAKYDDAPEYIVHLSPTVPLRDISILDKGIEKILSCPLASSLRSVCPACVVPQKMFKMEGPYLKSFFLDDPRKEYYNLPRQAFQKAFISNGHVDVVRASIIKTGVLHGENMLGFITERIPDIDEIKDFKYAKESLKDKRFKKLIQFMKKNYE